MNYVDHKQSTTIDLMTGMTFELTILVKSSGVNVNNEKCKKPQEVPETCN